MTVDLIPLDPLLLRRIKGEFLEMPGLRLTSAQARRLWGLAPDTCEVVLTALVTAGFLRQMRDGAFARYDVGSC